MESFEEAIEITKLQKENAHIYKLPPLTTSAGYSYDDFKELIFKGNMKITVKGDICLVYFINENEELPFLISIIEWDFEKYVSQASGSTRYFTIKAMTMDKVQNVYGLAFKQRNDSFDFYNTLVDFKEKLLFERKLKEKQSEEYKAKYDFDKEHIGGSDHTNQGNPEPVLNIKKQEQKQESKTGFNKFKFGDPTKK